MPDDRRVFPRLPALDFMVFADTEWMGGPFIAFVSVLRIDGLAYVRDRRLDLLAVHAQQPGQGDFTHFLVEAQRRYDTVGIWEIWNERLHAMLTRRGFVPATEVFHSVPVTGLIWHRPT